MESQPPGTEIGGQRRTFQSTLWTVILRAKDPASPERRQALQTLIETYWKPIYFFVRRRGVDSESAKDVTQGFFTTLLERDFLKHVDRHRGKFRTFLLSALGNYQADEHDRRTALKRGGDKAVFALDFIAAEVEASRKLGSRESPDQLFRREWAVRVMSQALHIVRSEFASKGREAEFDALRLHLSPGASEPASYASIATALGVGEQDVANRIHRARSRYKEAILEVIRSYSETDEDAKAELRDLFSAFA